MKLASIVAGLPLSRAQAGSPPGPQGASAMDQILVAEAVHNIGPDCDRTLMAWWKNCNRA